MNKNIIITLLAVIIVVQFTMTVISIKSSHKGIEEINYRDEIQQLGEGLNDRLALADSNIVILFDNIKTLSENIQILDNNHWRLVKELNSLEESRYGY